jgi:hypothetical protein
VKSEGRRLSPVEQLAFALNASIVCLVFALTMFMRFGSPITSRIHQLETFANLSQAEIADRLTVVVLLILCVIGFFVIPKYVSGIISETAIRFWSITALALIVLTISWRWGDPLFAEYSRVLWFGWGDKFALLMLAVSLLLTYLVSTHLKKFVELDKSHVTSLLNIGAYIVLFCYYLPSAIQPFKGIIDIWHSRYVLSEFLIVASGAMPYSEIVPIYVGFLSWPLKAIAFLPVDAVVNSALIWVNLLVVIQIFGIAYLTKKSLNLKHWGVALLIPVAVIYIKVQPNIHSVEEATYRRAWGSIAQYMSIIPARTVLPIVLLVLISEVATRSQSRTKSIFCFLAGLSLVFTPFNNIEFGVPASIAVIIILFFITRLSLVGRNDLLNVFLGSLAALTFIVASYKANESSINLSNWSLMARAHGVDGVLNLAMPFFGLWTFFYAILGASAILGSNYLFGVFRSRKLDNTDIRSSILLAFGGLWGSSTLIYFSGRSLVPALVSSLIPLSFCIVGLAGLTRSKISTLTLEDSNPLENRPLKLVFAPLFCVLLIPIISLTQAPNPSFEWLRMGGAGDKWSSLEIKKTNIYLTLIDLRDRDSGTKYVFMGDYGPAISMLSGVQNGLGLILIKDLLISDEIREVGCSPALNSQADFALVPKGDWDLPDVPCPGFVPYEPDGDSPFLFFKIPAKVVP